jgi:hypothetical protein
MSTSTTYPTTVNISTCRLDEDGSSYEKIWLSWEDSKGNTRRTVRDDDTIYRDTQEGIIVIFANDVKIEYRFDPERSSGDPADGYLDYYYSRA